MCILNPGHSLSEITDGRLHYRETKWAITLTDDVDPDFVLEQAHAALAEEERRREILDQKSTSLLTIGAILLAGNAALLRYSAFPGLHLIPLLPLVAALFLLLMYFRTYRKMAVHRSSIDWSKHTKTIKRELASQLFEAAFDLEPINAFRVGVQRAARRAIIVSVLLIIPVALISFASNWVS